MAKLRLLEHGFLVAAKSLDDLRLNTQKRSKGGEGEEDDDEPAESYEAFEMRVNAYVAAHLATASSSKRDSYKDSLVYQARKDVIQDFLKATILKKCQNPSCGACVSLYVDGNRMVNSSVVCMSGIHTLSGRRVTPRSSNMIFR